MGARSEKQKLKPRSRGQRTNDGDQKAEVTRADLNAEKIKGSSRPRGRGRSEPDWRNTRGGCAPQIEDLQAALAQVAEWSERVSKRK